MHGIWPPPEDFDSPPPSPRRERRHTSNYQQQNYRHPHHDPFYFARNSDPFHSMPRHRSGHGHHHGMPPRHHADPFEVFNAVFGQFDRHFKEMFPPMPQFQVFPHEPRMGMPHRPHDLPALFIPDMPDMYSHSTSHGFPGSAGGHRAMRQETRVTTTINGVTESIWTRTDDNVRRSIVCGTLILCFDRETSTEHILTRTVERSIQLMASNSRSNMHP